MILYLYAWGNFYLSFVGNIFIYSHGPSLFKDLFYNFSVAGTVATPTATTSSTAVTTENTFSELSTIPAEKSSLDLFGSELKLFPEPPVENSPAVLQKPAQPTTAVSADTSAPWIVTVSMYWNDLPAIMIDNAPFVRLVDIHKQILPAKDTGILKKRCQLLGIEVLNCTEMQRYFLVQYGKAFNSKSTLIISKDDAKSLIGYYVNPGSHPPRVRCRTMGDKTRVPIQNNRSVSSVLLTAHHCLVYCLSQGKRDECCLASNFCFISHFMPYQ